MSFLTNARISIKVFIGFGVILLLLLSIASFGVYSLIQADAVFKQYRGLARQTNAEGRIQANMLMTRIYAKNFVIEASEENIQGVRDRAEKTIRMIEEARQLVKNPQVLEAVDSLQEELRTYIADFEAVTRKQEERNIVVKKRMNVIGPETERNLTAIMLSANADADVEAAYLGGVALRNLLLARLYAQRFLIQNDQASYERVLTEFKELEKSQEELEKSLENPRRRELAWSARRNYEAYLSAFKEVHAVINERNQIIHGSLDRIGPQVAEQVENMKLRIKAEQDTLGPKAEAAMERAVIFALVVSLLSITLGILVGALIGRGIARPVRSMTAAMRELAGGNVNVSVSETGRRDEVGQMAAAVEVFRESMAASQRYEEERRKAEREIRESRDAAEAANKELDDKNTMLNGLSRKLSKYLSPQIYENIFSGASDVVLRTDRKKLTVFFSDIKDFTQTTGDLQPEDLAYLLNEYFSEMSQIALHHGATIDKFIGDAMLLFFGDPQSKGVVEDARSCLRMSIAMQRRMRDLQEVWKAKGFTKPLQMRIGINTGFCNVGNFGSNERMDYTIIGGEVNLAARLESQADPDGILISYETYAHVKDIVEVEERPSLVAKGISRDVRPFAVTNIFQDFEHEKRVLRHEGDGIYVMVDTEKLKGEAREKALAEIKSIVDRLGRTEA